ncbi:hypothetical protein GCM10011342_29730 [Aquisalinus flavus]|uniref:DUF4149 domain-containing protein n=1 Tax=Aquisalinus flavus TaxID=1526572 RepID=A0A8J2Y762_9PROT|nr:hypothetical protein [Aquisalinus flavus]MBD0428046.1 hypothetical protein [Aquisalinus flavus]GGD19077.1 hypothetical protein GCM10011342_29730 [Aquisalinus flavus]
MSDTLLKSLAVIAFFVGLSILGLSLLNIGSMLSPPAHYGTHGPSGWWTDRVLTTIIHLMFLITVCMAMIALYAISHKGLTASLTTRCIFIAGFALTVCGCLGMLQSVTQMPYHLPAVQALQASGQSGLGYAARVFLDAFADNGKTLVIGFMLIVLARHLGQKTGDKPSVPVTA